MHGETGATEEALESMEAAASIAMADRGDGARTRDTVVALIKQLSADLPSYIEELATAPVGASEQAHPADNC
ncbi:hypothetical protein ACWGQT_33120 [Streptomyces yangpuensis]